MYMDVASQKWLADRDKLDARLNDILGDVTDTRLVDVLLALVNAVADYSDDEDENVVTLMSRLWTGFFGTARCRYPEKFSKPGFQPKMA